jgi:hypothetical protein
MNSEKKPEEFYLSACGHSFHSKRGAELHIKNCGECLSEWSGRNDPLLVREVTPSDSRKDAPLISEDVLERLAVAHANVVSDPEFEDFHGRSVSYKMGFRDALNRCAQTRARFEEGGKV